MTVETLSALLVTGTKKKEGTERGCRGLHDSCRTRVMTQSIFCSLFTRRQRQQHLQICTAKVLDMVIVDPSSKECQASGRSQRRCQPMPRQLIHRQASRPGLSHATLAASLMLVASCLSWLLAKMRDPPPLTGFWPIQGGGQGGPGLLPLALPWRYHSGTMPDIASRPPLASPSIPTRAACSRPEIGIQALLMGPLRA